MAILRRAAAAGVSAALLHFADACCAAGVAIPPVWPAGNPGKLRYFHAVPLALAGSGPSVARTLTQHPGIQLAAVV